VFGKLLNIENMNFTKEQRDLGVQRINAYDFEFLRERYVGEHPIFASSFNEAVEELKRVFMLTFSARGPLAAMSHAVDELWHLFIMHTPQYYSFCLDIFGEYLHHQPRSAAIPVPASAISNFYLEYPKHFGSVPEIWFDDIPASDRVAVAAGQVPSTVVALKWSGWPGWGKAVDSFMGLYRSK